MNAHRQSIAQLDGEDIGVVTVEQKQKWECARPEDEHDVRTSRDQHVGCALE